MEKPAYWLFVSDVDDTLLGDNAALYKLFLVLGNSPLVIAYNSSRPCADLRRSLHKNQQLFTPNYLIGALGTEIEGGATGQKITSYCQPWANHLDFHRIWEIVAYLGFKPHAPEYQTLFKISFDVPDQAAYDNLVKHLHDYGIQAKTIYSGNLNVDILPPSAGKLSPILYLCQRLGIGPERVVVAGDSENDLDMFVQPHKGIIVGNAVAALKALQGPHLFHAESPYAYGVLEGLSYWGVVK